MTGRELKRHNDLFCVFSLIEHIAGKTKNHRLAVVEALGTERIQKIYDLADICHSDIIDRVRDEFIEAAGIVEGEFDNVALARKR